jgi:hypothetical protein
MGITPTGHCVEIQRKRPEQRAGEAGDQRDRQYPPSASDVQARLIVAKAAS